MEAVLICLSLIAPGLQPSAQEIAEEVLFGQATLHDLQEADICLLRRQRFTQTEEDRNALILALHELHNAYFVVKGHGSRSE